MKMRFFAIFLFFVSITIFPQEPPAPVFDNITVSCSVSYECPPGLTCFYNYKYLESNPPTNTMEIDDIFIPVNDLMEDVILPQPIDFNKRTVAHSHHETYDVDYISDKYPIRTGLQPEGNKVLISGLLPPGATCLYPDEVPSYKPPTIKTLWIEPSILDIYSYTTALAEYRGVEPEDITLEEVRDIDLSYIRKVPSLGPSPAFLGSFEQWDLLISDVSKSKEIGWVSDNNLFTAIDQRLKAGRQAAYDGNLNVANTKLQEVIDLILSSNQSQRKDEFYYLVYYNAQELKDRIPWPCEPKLTATPNYAKHNVGEVHQIEATLINQANGYPIADQRLIMEITDGPNAGIMQEVMTDSQGKAHFSYKGFDEGLDKIEIKTTHGGGTFAETGKPSEKSPKKKEAKKFFSKKGEKGSKSSRAESDCSFFEGDLIVTGLFAEWEGFIDLLTMLSPKVMDVVPGQKINLEATVFNYGDVSSPQTTLRFKMADKPFNNDPPPEGTVIGEVDVAPLESGKLKEYTKEATIPNNATAGKYYFDACVDPDDLIAEKIEWNNCASSIVSLHLTIPKIDNTPPDCSKAKANPEKLWPPNHKLENIKIEGITDPENDPFTITVTSITQDEPTNGLGDGDTSPDGFGAGTSNPQVRSERSGKGNGRVYQINFKAVDSKGGECSGYVKVGVPHDKKDTPIDDGQNYDSTKP